MTATDTGVGKTTLLRYLIPWFQRAGTRVTALKPAETGCFVDRGNLIASDAELIARTLSITSDQVVTYRFASPVAPAVASLHEAQPIELSLIQSRIEELRRHNDLVFVEGAGGLLVPITFEYSYADLARDCAMPVLVVVGSRLGALNQALLTFEVLRARGLHCLGYVLNDLFQESTPTGGATVPSVDAIQTNREALTMLASRYEIEEIGYLPRLCALASDSIDLGECTPEMEKLGTEIKNRLSLAT